MKNLVFQLCVFAVAGWDNRGQQQVIEYLVEENRVLRGQLSGRRLRLTKRRVLRPCRQACRQHAEKDKRDPEAHPRTHSPLGYSLPQLRRRSKMRC